MWRRRIGLATVLLIGLGLLWMTLRPNPTVTSDLAPVIESGAAIGIGPYVWLNLLGNVTVFVPLGAAVTLALPRSLHGRVVVWGAAGGAALSLGIELAQLLVASRASSVVDWALNTLGAALGAGLVHVTEKLYRRVTNRAA